jgi:octanoyl-[GcvH]:protein N-octanoyltransferase
VTGGDELRAVLADVYAALELEWDPATAGAIADEVPGASLDAVERAVISAYEWDLADAGLDAATLALADTLEVRHAAEARTPAG